MKKLLSVVLIAVMLLASLTVFVGCVPREDTLKILNWAEYIDEDLIDEFVQHIADTENGRKIRVRYSSAETNEEMYSKIKQGKRDFDLLCPSDYMISRMADEGLLNEINFSEVKNAVDYTSPYVLSLYDVFDQDISKYTVGYTWGTMGIVYNPQMLKDFLGYNDQQVEALVSSWNALWAKDKNGNDIAKLKKGKGNAVTAGTISMKNSVRDNFFIASTYVNGSAAKANDTSQTNLDKVKEALKTQKNLARYWEVDTLRTEIINTSKNVAMGLQWAGDAKYSIDEAAAKGLTLKYSVPDEGSNVFFDGWVVPKYSKNQDLAQKFLNFMCQPEIAARNMEYVGYTSVIATEEFFDNEFIAEDDNAVLTDISYFLGQDAGTTFKMVSPVYYPEKSVLDKCVVMLDFKDRNKAVNDMWNGVK